MGTSKNEVCKGYMKGILQRTLNLQMSIFPHVQINVLLIMKQGLQEKTNWCDIFKFECECAV